MGFKEFFQQYGGVPEHPRGDHMVATMFSNKPLLIHGWLPIGDEWVFLVEEVEGSTDGRFLRLGMIDGECFSDLLTFDGLRDVFHRLCSAPSGLVEYVIKGSITPSTIDLTPANNNFGHKPIRAIDR